MKPYSRAVERNLLKCWDYAESADYDAGMTWYQRGHETCRKVASDLGLPTEAVCGAVAALSPGKAWEANVSEATRFLGALKKGEPLPIVGAYGKGNCRKAEAIGKGAAPLDVLKGPKVRAFYANLVDPRGGEVCIDRHAKAAALGMVLGEAGWGPAKEMGITNVVRPSEYEWIATHYRHAAAKVGVLPSQFQAVCWVTWKRLKAETGAEPGVNLLRRAA